MCKGGSYPAQLKYKMLADMACSRIFDGITRTLLGSKPIKAVLDPYNPVGSTAHVNFNTSKLDWWQTDARRCHLNWVILDSDWEAEFCRVAETHPRVKACVKNHNLGLEVPYRYGSEMRKYFPDFIVLVDDALGEDDLLHLIVGIKGYRREDAKEQREYAILTAEISRATFGMTPTGYKTFKSLDKPADNLRDHMTDLGKKSGKRVASTENYKALPEAVARKRLKKKED